jgi:hypothetical protein
MTVAELLDRMTSREISEWQAYEQATGPLGHAYMEEALASIHEQLQMLNRLTGAQFEDNPAPNVQQWPRPPDIFARRAQESEDSQDDEVDQATFDQLFDE